MGRGLFFAQTRAGQSEEAAASVETEAGDTQSNPQQRHGGKGTKAMPALAFANKIRYTETKGFAGVLRWFRTVQIQGKKEGG